VGPPKRPRGASQRWWEASPSPDRSTGGRTSRLSPTLDVATGKLTYQAAPTPRDGHFSRTLTDSARLRRPMSTTTNAVLHDQPSPIPQRAPSFTGRPAGGPTENSRAVHGSGMGERRPAPTGAPLLGYHVNPRGHSSAISTKPAVENNGNLDLYDGRQQVRHIDLQGDCPNTGGPAKAPG